jgi:hypothetical protein
MRQGRLASRPDKSPARKVAGRPARGRSPIAGTRAYLWGTICPRNRTILLVPTAVSTIRDKLPQKNATQPSCGSDVAMLIDRRIVGEPSHGKEGNASGQETMDQGGRARSEGPLEGQNACCKDRKGDEENGRRGSPEGEIHSYRVGAPSLGRQPTTRPAPVRWLLYVVPAAWRQGPSVDIGFRLVASRGRPGFDPTQDRVVENAGARRITTPPCGNRELAQQRAARFSCWSPLQGLVQKMLVDPSSNALDDEKGSELEQRFKIPEAARR